MRTPTLLALALLLVACGPERRGASAGGGGGGGAQDGGGQQGGGQGGDGAGDAGQADGDGGGAGDDGAGDGAGDDGAGDDGQGDDGQGDDGQGDDGQGDDGQGDDGQGDDGGADDGQGDDGGNDDGGDGDGPFAFYDCSGKVFPDEDIDDIKDEFSPADWREAALGVLDRRFPDGAWVARELNDDEDFDRWFGQRNSFDGVLDDLNTGVHEGVHILGFQNFGMEYSYVLGEDDIVGVPRTSLFMRSEVYDQLPEVAKSGFYADLYLRQIGNQDFDTLLDEFNAYTYSLLVDIAIADQFSPMSARTSRDGLATFMLFTQVYLHIARTEHPDAYERFLNAGNYAEFVLLLFDRAWCVYELSGDDPRLEIDASDIMEHVLDDEWLEEVDRLRAAVQG